METPARLASFPPSMTSSAPMEKLRALIIEQQRDSPAGVAGEWLAARGFAIDTWRPPEEDEPPDVAAYACVVPLGSEESATQREPAWIPFEIEVLRRAADAGVPVLGLCFG